MDPIFDRFVRDGIRYPNARKGREDALLADRTTQRASSHRRRARTLGADGSFTRDEWRRLLERYGGACGYCGSREQMSADHRIPLARGGRNDIANIIPACLRCNMSKGTQTEAEFRAR